MSILIARDHVREPLYVVVPYFNPWRWKSRIKHTERALKHFHDSGATIMLVEVAFNRREAVFQESGLDGMATNCGLLGTDSKFRHKYVLLRTKEELWLKENAINIGVQNLPFDWQQVAWCDSDVHFLRPNWVGECIHKLQHYAFVQMFSQARDLSPNYELMAETYPHAAGLGWVETWKRGFISTTITPEIEADLAKLAIDVTALLGDLKKLVADITDGPPYGQAGPKHVFPGLAWACTRQAWDQVGGLPDYAIWGGGDWHLSHCLVERKQNMVHSKMHANYKAMVERTYDKCVRNIRRNIGVVEGTVTHHWHGRKTGRGYAVKHRTLAKFGFDPITHLKRDSQGLWQLHDDGSESFVQIRDYLRVIARERNEDSPDTREDLQEQGH